MRRRVKWTAGLIGIAIVGMFVISSLTISSILGGTPVAGANGPKESVPR
jgi:hypothetical protein